MFLAGKAMRPAGTLLSTFHLHTCRPDLSERPYKIHSMMEVLFALPCLIEPTKEERLSSALPAGDEVGGPPAAACRLPDSAAGASPSGDRMSRNVPAHNKASM